MIEQLQIGQIPQRRKIKVQLKPDSQIYILSSMFDSGNMGKVQIGPNNSILFSSVFDCTGTQYESHSKGWFYFSIQTNKKSSKIKIIITKVSQLWSTAKISDYFKPVYKYDKQQWKRFQNAQTISKQDDTQLHLDFQFTKLLPVYFAFTYPFSYQDCEKYLLNLSTEFKKSKDIYFKDQILIKSPLKRNIHLITISSYDNMMNQEENIQDQFVLKIQENKKCMKFEIQKKVILISARVHPAQVPSSHTFNGIVNFLTSKDARSYFLRKKFVFKLVPMLNPDGVSRGNYRMDIFNQNLNRFYLNPDPQRQPSAYAMKKLGQYFSSQNRLCFYLDLHAHPQKKGNFIYGNNFQNSQTQAQTQLFAKILSLNCIQFDYQNSSFDQKHMSLKDKNQPFSKQGCGRVVFQKYFSQIYSYTMECGYTCSSKLNQIVAIQKSNRKFQKLGIINDQFDNIKSSYYSSANKNIYFSIQSYQALGKAILVSILDLFLLNPASRIPNTMFKNVQGIRKQLLWQVSKGSKFNKNIRIYNKKPTSNQSINSQQGFRSKTIIKSSNTIANYPLNNGLNIISQKIFNKQYKNQISRNDKNKNQINNKQQIKKETNYNAIKTQKLMSVSLPKVIQKNKNQKKQRFSGLQIISIKKQKF